MFRHLILSYVLLCSFCCGIVHSQDSREKMPQEDVVQVPAIGKGFCVSNIFQTNTVLQRDKPLSVWGWAEPGEKVTVSFAGQTADAAAGADRSWKVPLDGLSVKGAVFHQGFNNCFNGSAGARMYYQVFGKMIAAWRSAFGDPQMPFCIISLCTAGEPQTRENFLKPMYDVGVFIREAQYETFRDLYDAGDKGIGFVSCFDLRKSWYHPQIKVPAGERVAKWALATQYNILQGRDAHQYWLPPSIKDVDIVDDTIRLKMSTAIQTRDDSDGELLGFAIAGKDRRFYPADVQWYTDGSVDNRNRAQYQRDVLVLSSPFVAEPAHYRHAWARNPMSNIVNARGVRLATQRSDDWILEETPIKFPLPPNTDLKSQARRIRGLLTKELELADTERRIKEAEATITELKPALEKARADTQKKK